jgi:three-Cys-motif partner protein
MNLGADGYCTLVKGVDELPLRCVGHWGQRKVFYLRRYFNQVGVALGKHNLNYIEICSGPGRCIDYRSGDEFDGSALAVLKSSAALRYERLFFFDHDKTTTDILRERIDRSPEIAQEVKDKTVISIGDYNDSESIAEVIKKHSPAPWLNLVFIDPTDVSVPYSLTESLMQLCVRTDFIFNLVDGVDLRRNLAKAIALDGSKIRSKYSKVLNNSEAFFGDDDILSLANDHDIVGLVGRYVQEFLKPYREKGYNNIYDIPILHYYKLYLLSKNDLGRKFWQNATAKTVEEAEISQGLLF